MIDEDDYEDDDIKDDHSVIDVDAIVADEPSTPSPGPEQPFPSRFEVQQVVLGCGCVKAGDVVQLKDESQITLRNRQYGDFLLVKSVVEDVISEEVFLQGLRLRRCSRLQPIFDSIYATFMFCTYADS